MGFAYLKKNGTAIISASIIINLSELAVIVESVLCNVKGPRVRGAMLKSKTVPVEHGVSRHALSTKTVNPQI